MILLILILIVSLVNLSLMVSVYLEVDATLQPLQEVRLAVKGVQIELMALGNKLSAVNTVASKGIGVVTDKVKNSGWYKKLMESEEL
jgi:hypothetical protein